MKRLVLFLVSLLCAFSSYAIEIQEETQRDERYIKVSSYFMDQVVIYYFPQEQTYQMSIRAYSTSLQQVADEYGYICIGNTKEDAMKTMNYFISLAEKELGTKASGKDDCGTEFSVVYDKVHQGVSFDALSFKGEGFPYLSIYNYVVTQKVLKKMLPDLEDFSPNQQQKKKKEKKGLKELL